MPKLICIKSLIIKQKIREKERNEQSKRKAWQKMIYWHIKSLILGNNSTWFFWANIVNRLQFVLNIIRLSGFYRIFVAFEIIQFIGPWDVCARFTTVSNSKDILGGFSMHGPFDWEDSRTKIPVNPNQNLILKKIRMIYSKTLNMKIYDTSRY